MSARTRTTRAKLGYAVQRYGADSPQAVEAKRVHKETMLAEHIAEVVNSAPPLTAEMIERLRSLLSTSPSITGDPR